MCNLGLCTWPTQNIPQKKSWWGFSVQLTQTRISTQNVSCMYDSYLHNTWKNFPRGSHRLHWKQVCIENVSSDKYSEMLFDTVSFDLKIHLPVIISNLRTNYTVMVFLVFKRPRCSCMSTSDHPQCYHLSLVACIWNFHKCGFTTSELMSNEQTWIMNHLFNII